MATETASKKKHTIYHVLILDRSSSMSSVRDVTISGFNENLQSLQSNKPDNDVEEKVCLVTFAYDVRCDVWKKPSDSVEALNTKSYVPDGGTALYDAIGTTVTRLNDEIRDEIKSQDANVIVTIFTDGDENSSKEWKDYTKVSKLRAELEATRMWTFTFIGCSEEQLRKTTAQLGFSAANTMRYAATAEGTKNAFEQLTTSRMAYRTKISNSVALKGDAVAYASSLEESQKDFFAGIDPADKKS
jgi:uncharacterized protein YegL